MQDFLQEELERAKQRKPKYQGLIEKIEKGYLEGASGKEVKKKRFSASTLVWGSGACPRRWYYSFQGSYHESDLTTKSVPNMTSGTDAHERIQKAALHSGAFREVEVKVSNENPPILGFVDAIIDWDGETFLGEIKTMGTPGFEYRKRTGKVPGYHIMQLLIYMRLMSMDKGLFIYEHKADHELLIFPLEMTQEYEEWLIDAFKWMGQTYDAYEKGMLPVNVIRRKNSKICKGCPVKKICFDDREGDIKIPLMRTLK